MANNHQHLVAFVLEYSQQLPITRRAQVLRGLAEKMAISTERKELIAQAESLEAADRRCREFAFNYLTQ